MKILLLVFILTFYNSVKAQNEPELFPANDRKVGLIGYFLADGTNVVKAQFCSAGYNIDGYYMVSKAEHEYYQDGRRKEGHIPNTEKFGLLNSKGNFIIDFNNNYGFIGVEKGIIYVIKDNLYGTVNNKNEKIIPIEYDELEIQNQGIIIAKKNKKNGIITKDNKIIIPFDYDKINSFAEDKLNNNFFVVVSSGNKEGILNKNNKFILPLSEIEIKFVTPKTICIKKNGKYSLVDHKLQALLPNDFEEMSLDFDQSKITGVNNGYEYHFTIEGKLLKKIKIFEEGMKVAN